MLLCEKQIEIGHSKVNFLHNYDSLNPRGQVSIFKTLEMRSAQSSAVNLTNASKFENQKIKVRFWRPTFSEGAKN